MTRSLPFSLLAGAACVAAASTPAAAAPAHGGPVAAAAKTKPPAQRQAPARRKAPAKPKKLSVLARADPAAPAGEVPKVIFEVHHAVKGRSYRLTAHLTRGEDRATCTGTLGSTTPVKAMASGVLTFDRTPWDVADADNGYDVLRGDVCRGVYEGELEESGGRIPRSVELVLAVPAMTVDVVARYG
jgi:hypothetical protein